MPTSEATYEQNFLQTITLSHYHTITHTITLTLSHYHTITLSHYPEVVNGSTEKLGGKNDLSTVLDRNIVLMHFFKISEFSNVLQYFNIVERAHEL